MKISPLEWDSDFFGVPISKVLLKSNNFVDTKKLGNEFYYIFSDNIIDSFPPPIDVKVDFKMEIDFSDRKKGERCIQIKNANVMMFDNIKPLCYEAGKFSRFKKDILLSKQFAKLYDTWLLKSLDRTIADKVFVYEENKQILGFITLKINSEGSARIGLIAVDPYMQGKGIGKQLINHAINYCGDGIKLFVATQYDNSSACSFYSRLGFIKNNISYIYHLNLLSNDSI